MGCDPYEKLNKVKHFATIWQRSIPSQQCKARPIETERIIYSIPLPYSTVSIYSKILGAYHTDAQLNQLSKSLLSIICYMDSATGVGAGARQTVGFINFASLSSVLKKRD